MNSNPMRAALTAGRPQIGTWLTMVRNPEILSLMKAAGLDFARVDMEHTALTIERIADMALVSRALDFPIAVRPPKANREWITRLLDIGVWNLHCPQVENLDHAKEIVAASRYAPMGLRGNGGLSVSTGFDGTLSAAAKRENANRQVFVTVMFETGAAFKDLDAIAALPAKVIDEHRDRVLAACKKHGKVCAMLVNSFEQMQHWRDAGALLLAYSSDVDILYSGYSAAMKRIKGG
jgi:2-keto-3-deoxy-L-rhamnonate aldolase RhmA